MTVEHIVPEARGGKTIEDRQFVAGMLACNEFKGVRMQAVEPATGHRVRLFNPRKQRWKAHFRWSEDGTESVGLTPCGRATVVVLQLNRPEEVVGARWLWVQAGWWPPVD